MRPGLIAAEAVVKRAKVVSLSQEENVRVDAQDTAGADVLIQILLRASADAQSMVELRLKPERLEEIAAGHTVRLAQIPVLTVLTG